MMMMMIMMMMIMRQPVAPSYLLVNTHTLPCAVRAGATTHNVLLLAARLPLPWGRCMDRGAPGST
jgi:hypothetical protein